MIRTDWADEDELEYGSDQIERVFKALQLIAGVDDPLDLIGERLALPDETRIELALGEEGARVVLEEGTWPELEVDDEVVEILGELDGRATLAEAIERARVPRRRSTLDDIRGAPRARDARAALTSDDFPQCAGNTSASPLRAAGGSSYIAAPAGHGARVGRSFPSGREGRKPGSVGREVDESVTGPAGFFWTMEAPRAPRR